MQEVIMKYSHLENVKLWSDSQILFEQDCRRLKSEVEKRLKAAPPGRIDVRGKRGKYYFYQAEGTTLQYLNASQQELVRSLAQKRYDFAVLRLMKDRTKKAMMADEFVRQLKEVYEKLHPGLKPFVSPAIVSDQELVDQWLSVEYVAKEFKPGSVEHYSMKGLRVRSKSEGIIANILDKYEIPFRYEKPLYLDKLGMVYPDFEVLNVRTRTVFIWEHLGIMDEIGYGGQAVERLEAYHREGYYEGKNLILTMESLRYPMNTRKAEEVVKQYLL